jgi:hypothetical protein
LLQAIPKPVRVFQQGCAPPAFYLRACDERWFRLMEFIAPPLAPDELV